MALILDGNLGITTPAETVQGALTTTGNTILGDATTDTLTVGVTGIVKDASGNVGIGTASPTVKLDVVTSGGAGLISNTSYRAAAGQSSWASKFARGTSSSPTIVVSGDTIGSYESYPYNGTNFSLQTASISTIVTGSVTSSSIPTAIVFSTDAAGAAYSNERMRIDSSGNLSLASGTFSAIGVYNNTTASAANIHVSSAGGLFFRSTSALKYKQYIRDLESIDIGLLRPVRYKSKCDGDDKTKDHFGLIADEAAEAGFEELVTRGADGEVEGFQYERLTVVLLKAIQELKAIVDAQAVRIAALES